MDKKLGIGAAILAGTAALAVIGFAKAKPPSYICPVCGESFPDSDTLYTHFVNEHPAEDITIIWD